MRLILCCDYGLDDAAATVDALAHAKEDGYEGVSLVAIGGNVPCAVALKNAQKLVAALAPSVPVEIVDTTQIAQREEFLTSIHGGDGMGDLFAEARHPVSPVALSEFLNSLTGEYDLLSLGPMTVVPYILKRGRCRKFVFMGGNVAEIPNFHGYEFNHALDRTAFAEVVKNYPHVAVTMDTCRHPLLNIQNAPPEGDGLLRKIVRRSREMTFVSGEKGCYVWDDIAVKYLRHPDWFELYKALDNDGNRLTVARYTLGKRYEEILEL